MRDHAKIVAIMSERDKSGANPYGNLDDARPMVSNFFTESGMVRALHLMILGALWTALFTGPVYTQAASRYDGLIGIIARRHHMEPAFVKAVIRCESNFDTLAVSPKGAQGLMQLMPATQATLGVTDAFEPLPNIDGGVRYLPALRQTFGTDRTLLLAAYNAGPQAVIHAGYAVPNYAETKHYIACVERARRRYRAQGFNIQFANLPPAGRASDHASGGLAVTPPRLLTSAQQVGQRVRLQFDTWNTGAELTHGVVSVTYPPALLSLIALQMSPDRTTVYLPTPPEPSSQATFLAAPAYTFLQDTWPQWRSGQRHSVTLALIPRIAQDVVLHLSVILYDPDRKTMRHRWSRMVRIPVQPHEEDGSR